MKCIRAIVVGSAVVLVLAGCGKKDGGKAGDGMGRVPEVVAKPEVAKHLGFASRVPGDADVFLAGYDADGVFKRMAEKFKGDEELAEDKKKEFEEVVKRLGSEHFLFVGGGAGRQLGQVILTHREYSSMMAGYLAGAVLDKARDGDFSPEPPALEDVFPVEMMDGWIDAIVRDKNLVVPSVVVGWHPDAAEQAQCLVSCRGFVADCFKEVKEAQPVEFEAYGGVFSGYMIKGDVLCQQVMEESGNAMGEHKEKVEEWSRPYAERMEKLLEAVEKMEFTVASGVVDGRVLVYVGNGKEGFRLADNPEDSVAAEGKLGWTSELEDHPHRAVMYLSESMVESVIPMLDNSALWNRLAEAVRAPIRDEQTVRKLLEHLAEGSGRLARRDADAFSMVLFRDRGYRCEARGGWLDPGLDYDRPLRMESAVMAGSPVFRAHWVRNRARQDAEWRQMELLGILAETLLMDVMSGWKEEMEKNPEIDEGARRVVREVRKLGHMYGHEFRAGLGDEVAVMADLRGEIPPVPGISQDTIRDFTMPRVLVAMPVVDRALVEKSGRSLYGQWRDLTAWASASADFHIPVIAPQLIESGGVSTWYPPAPFIGGDFVPGVSMNNELWMMGTSRSMVAGFTREFAKSNRSGETGVVAELDVAPLRDWCVGLYQRGEADAKEALGGSLAVLEVSPAGMHDVNEWFQRMETVRYRHWKEDGQARWSLHVKMADPVR